MIALGAELKRLREEKNIPLAQMAGDTRISIRHFQNLEACRYSDLPGGIYDRAFLRAYCNYLNLDPAEYLQAYERETGTARERPCKSLSAKQPSPSKSHPLAVWMSGLILSITGLYLSRGWIGAVSSPYFSRPMPVVLATDKPVPHIPVRVEPVVDTSSTASPAVALKAETAAAETVSSADPEPEEVLSGRFRLSFDVVEDCWMSLSSDGNRVLVQLLKPGEGHSYAANEQFSLVVGNAAGVHLRVNGMPLKPLGKPGVVVRLQITEQNLQELLDRSVS